MLVLGLTGSIGMGKSTCAGLFREAGVPVHDADAAVHELYAGAAAPLIERAFPGSTRDGKVDRQALAGMVMSDLGALRRLEAVVHPLVAAVRETFVRAAAAAGHRAVVLDVPLLLESGGHRGVDAVVVVTAPEAVQKARVMARPGMTQTRFEAILSQQMPDSRKRCMAHFIIDSGSDLPAARRQVLDVLRATATLSGKDRWPMADHA
jgi:dephospho-CoA kinase